MADENSINTQEDKGEGITEAQCPTGEQSEGSSGGGNVETVCCEPGVALHVEEAAKECHALWLSEADRSYSPHNKPWDELTDKQKRDVSRTSALALQCAAKTIEAVSTMRVLIVDLWAPETNDTPAST